MSSRNDHSDFSLWDRQRGVIRSRKGGWQIGKGVFSHGYNMMDDLVGQASYFQIMMLNILGYLPERRLADWLEAMYSCMSWPDPRIWCNQIGALAGSMRTTVTVATTGGVLAADSLMYGGRTFLEGVGFIQQALKEVKAGTTARDVLMSRIKAARGKVRIVGYARPIAKGDERVEALERVTKGLGFEPGEHLRLAYEFNHILQQECNESININGYVSAFLSDQGLSAEEVYRLCAMCVMSGITACYIDTYEKPAGTFLPQKCMDIEYNGVEPRKLPVKANREETNDI